MSRAYASNGQEGRNHVQLELLEGVELEDVRAGLDYLRSHPEVDADRLAVAGHSFGGSLALLVAESDTMLRAVIDFAGAAGSWESSLPLQARLLAAVGRTRAPVFFIQAQNDYSVTPAGALAAEMTRLDKPHRIEIYPAIGSGAEDGHAFVRLGIAVWESDVFAFLDERMQR
jgi:dienelactone hydrolase